MRGEGGSFVRERGRKEVHSFQPGQQRKKGFFPPSDKRTRGRKRRMLSYPLFTLASQARKISF